MSNWRKYVDPLFTPPESRLLTRDRIPFICPICQKVTVLYVQNVRQKVAKDGKYICRSCSGKETYARFKEKNKK